MTDVTRLGTTKSEVMRMVLQEGQLEDPPCEQQTTYSMLPEGGPTPCNGQWSCLHHIWQRMAHLRQTRTQYHKYARSRTTITWSGTLSNRLLKISSSSHVPVGLFGFAINMTRVESSMLEIKASGSWPNGIVGCDSG